MANLPALSKRVLGSTVMALTEAAPHLSTAIESLMIRQDSERLSGQSLSSLRDGAMYRIELPTQIAEDVLAALEEFSQQFEDPALAFLNDPSLPQLIHEWTMAIEGLRQIRAPSA